MLLAIAVFRAFIMCLQKTCVPSILLLLAGVLQNSFHVCQQACAQLGSPAETSTTITPVSSEPQMHAFKADYPDYYQEYYDSPKRALLRRRPVMPQQAWDDYDYDYYDEDHQQRFPSKRFKPYAERPKQNNNQQQWASLRAAGGPRKRSRLHRRRNYRNRHPPSDMEEPVKRYRLRPSHRRPNEPEGSRHQIRKRPTFGTKTNALLGIHNHKIKDTNNKRVDLMESKHHHRFQYGRQNGNSGGLRRLPAMDCSSLEVAPAGEPDPAYYDY